MGGGGEEECRARACGCPPVVTAVGGAASSCVGGLCARSPEMLTLGLAENRDSGDRVNSSSASLTTPEPRVARAEVDSAADRLLDDTTLSNVGEVVPEETSGELAKDNNSMD